MSLFQTSVVKKYLSDLNAELIDKKYNEFQSYFGNPEIQQNIRESKEEEFQSGFVSALFVNILGYTLKPEPNYNFVLEKKNIDDSKKADGAILKDNEVIAVIELKSTQTTDLDTVETQAFGYKNHNPKCQYVITSNFEKIRLYIQNAVDHLEFDLFNLSQEDFALLWLCFLKDNILQDIPLKIKEASVLQEESVTKKLYNDYSNFRKDIFNNIVKNNPEHDKLVLFKKTQKLLDRFLFIFFAEDRLLVPPNSISEIVKQWNDLKEHYDEYFPLYDRFKKYFGYLNTGYKGKKYDIFPYNGGLFAPDEILDNIKIEDEILHKHTVQLSIYDFETDVDVNILGHIFEHSLGEIENVQAEIAGEEIDKQKTKRKKDGIFYTPKYITKYIVENTVGKLCEEKRNELEIIDEEYAKGRKNRKKDIVRALDDKLTAYRNWLLEITILDPACGSGAFLNQALEFLIQEHKKIDELKFQLLGGSIVFPDVEAKILEKNIYGVDLNEESVEIAKLSLWLRTAQKGRKLTTLSNHIKCGNSLIDDPEVAGEKAFNWQKEFPEIFSNGGFDVVIGNPPYVRQELLGKINKETYIKRFSCVGNGTADLYVYFYELGLNLIKPFGLLSFITPNKWFKTKYGREIRKYICKFNILEITDFFELKIFEDASTEPQIIIIENSKRDTKSFKYHPINNTNEFIESKKSQLIIENSTLSESGWVFADKDASSILSKLSTNSVSLKDYTNNGIKLGVKTALNKAFIINKETKDQIIKEDVFSAELIKPYVNAIDIKAWHLENSKSTFLINTGYDIEISEKSYKGIYNYLNQYKEELFKRQDKGKTPYNLRACDYYNLFSKPKIMFIYTAVNHYFYYDENGFYVNNSCFIIGNADKYISGILNSNVFKYYKILKFVSFGDSNTSGRSKLDYNKMVLFPIPNVTISDKEEIEQYVTTLQSHSEKLNAISDKFSNILNIKYSNVEITKKLRKFNVLDDSKLLSIMKKNKIKLKIDEKIELLQFFNALKDDYKNIKIEIDRTEHSLNKAIYKLYNLTNKEIAIIEKSL